MKIVLVGLGILFFCLGISYIYLPKIILKINSIGRRFLFNDNFITFYRKKIVIIYFFISSIILYFGFNLPGGNFLAVEQTKYELHQAYRNYYLGEYDKAQKFCENVLLREPHNLNAVKQLALIYFSKNDYKKAKIFSKIIINTEPENIKFKKIFEKCSQ